MRRFRSGTASKSQAQPPPSFAPPSPLVNGFGPCAALHGFDHSLLDFGVPQSVHVVVANVPIRGAINKAVNTLQTAMLLAAQIEADQRELRPGIERAAQALAALRPTTDDEA